MPFLISDVSYQYALYVKRESHKADCYSSNVNTCRALVKPNCTKRAVVKSTGVPTALSNVDLSSYMVLDTNRPLYPQTFQTRVSIYQ